MLRAIRSILVLLVASVTGVSRGAGGADRYTGVRSRDSGRRRRQWIVARGDGPIGPGGHGFLSLRHRSLAGCRRHPTGPGGL